MSRIKFYGALGTSTYMGIIYLGYMSTVSMRESPSKAAAHLAGSGAKSILSKKAAQELRMRGIVVLDNVLTSAEIRVARDEVLNLIDNTKSFSENDNMDQETRKDTVMWVSESIGDSQITTLGPGLKYALRCVRSVPGELVRLHGYDPLYLGVPFSNQLACYDGKGANYIPHRDTPELLENGESSHRLRWLLQPGIEERKLTIILYLNDESWNPTKERKYDLFATDIPCAKKDDIVGDTATEVLDIIPKGGRMVIFDSTSILHEVLPTSDRRMALTCWVGGSHSKHEYLRLLSVPLSEISWPNVRKDMYNYFTDNDAA